MKTILLSFIFLIVLAQARIVFDQQFKIEKKPNIRASIMNSFENDPNFMLFARGKFKQWMKKNMKTYNPEQFPTRFYNFEKNLQAVEKHNAQSSSFKMETNQFADLSDDEFKEIYLMTSEPIEKKMTAPLPPRYKLNGRFLLEKSVDYRNKIKMSQIKSQQACAACYAFACIGSIELHWGLKRRTDPPIFSQQHLIDCCKKKGYRCDGCKSGSLKSSLEFLANEGISTLNNYPYLATPQSCNQNRQKSFYLDPEMPYYQIAGVDYTIYYLIRRGPLTVGIDSTNWRFYKSGIFDDCTPEPRYIHAVTLVGVQSTGVWIIRNSWGANWGDQGYIRLAAGNTCGITDYVFLPNVL